MKKQKFKIERVTSRDDNPRYGSTYYLLYIRKWYGWSVVEEEAVDIMGYESPYVIKFRSENEALTHARILGYGPEIKETVSTFEL